MNPLCLLRPAIVSLFFLAAASVLRADVSLPAIFSDHGVLQRSGHTCVWGKAEPGEKVTVTLDKAQAEAAAGADGKWRAYLDLGATGDGPFTLTVAGKNRLVVSDVLVGDVWLCSGQSNMVMELHSCIGGPEEAAHANNPKLRQFNVTRVSVIDPQETVDGKWILDDPKTAGGFGGAAYYFGKKVQAVTGKSIGLIFDAYSGSNCSTWTSSEAIDKDPAVKAYKDAWLEEFRTFPKRLVDYQQKFHAWEAKYARQDHPHADVSAYAGPGVVPGDDWKTVTLTGSLSQFGLPEAGVIWLRRQVDVPAGDAGKKLLLTLGKVFFAEYYWNGTKIDDMTPDTLRRVVTWEPRGDFLVPPAMVKAGPATLAIRLRLPAAGAVIRIDEKHQPLMTGEWKAKVEYALPALDAAALAEYPGMPPFRVNDTSDLPTYQYNGMIHPILGYGIRGVLWYQGEANVTEACNYKRSMEVLIDDWREKWRMPDMPFYYCQLPNVGLKSSTPEDSTWAELREAQEKMLSIPYTGMSVDIDVGEVNLHPGDKKDVGERLADVALARTYGLKTPVPSPMFKSMAIEGNKVRIQFSNTGAGLKARPLPGTYVVSFLTGETMPLVPNSPGSQLEGFAICGSDHVWHWANATIDGSAVVVESPDVPAPVAVRYAWAGNPTCNLYNSDGMPAAPFRTDSFPMISEKTKPLMPDFARKWTIEE